MSNDVTSKKIYDVIDKPSRIMDKRVSEMRCHLINKILMPHTTMEKSNIFHRPTLKVPRRSMNSKGVTWVVPHHLFFFFFLAQTAFAFPLGSIFSGWHLGQNQLSSASTKTFATSSLHEGALHHPWYIHSSCSCAGISS